jgi:antirestriction protein ArdC
MKTNHIDTIVTKIIEQIEAGSAPWHKPWSGGSASYAMPVNALTGKTYKGVNILSLWSKEMPVAQWATFKQWQDKKEMVRKGEKGTMIVFWSTFERQTDAGKEEIPFLKTSFVFNRSQLQSYDAVTETPADKPSMVEALANADAFVTNTGANINHNGNGRAFYRQADDAVYMPKPDAFTGTATQTATEAYYATLLHELAHWTGAEKRLSRVKGKKFGDHAYAVEELIAEMSAAFMCAELGITDAPRPDHAAYLANWLGAIKETPRFLITAASMASKACDYLNELQTAKPVEAVPDVASLPVIPSAAILQPSQANLF